MKVFSFHRVNVFTDKFFSGNPLVVLPDAQGLEDAEMQLIAREMGTSETTFVFPSESRDAAYKVRIFTPNAEIPFAGHPSLGTAFVLAELGRFPISEPLTLINQELKVGVLPLEIYIKDGEIDRVVMTQKETEFGAELSDFKELASALGLEAEVIKGTGLSVAIISTGIPQVFVPLPDLQTIRNLRPKFFELREQERKLGVIGCCVFTLETKDKEALAHMRFFSPAQGVREDPATGSAAGGLGAYLALRGLLPKSMEFQIEQGEEVGRPSRIFVEVKVDRAGNPYKVKVGGKVISSMEGKIFL
ncbi:MAG: PhzF family phenazine biosynthesis protein [Caldiserica bacterium]|jgi:trans-2,3-dihydro-3-hydroxyanthranilate isomerase|nr:PhzF family phenazine biosynthesis protein [Caldisericota bacterium]MDH7562434.1 PhzF family phenazine biosynthesis protein [Caldisericota bacterium]